MQRLDSSEFGFADAFDALVNGRREADADVSSAVAQTIRDVRAHGDATLAEMTQRFDGFDLNEAGWQIDAAQCKAAYDALAPELRDALSLAAKRLLAPSRAPSAALVAEELDEATALEKTAVAAEEPPAALPDAQKLAALSTATDLFTGFLFALGLGVSGMLKPSKVAGACGAGWVSLCGQAGASACLTWAAAWPRYRPCSSRPGARHTASHCRCLPHAPACRVPGRAGRHL